MQMIDNNYLYNTRPSFCGVIKKTDYLTNYALDYARGIKLGDSEWVKLKMFINTLKAVKADKSQNVFELEKIGSAKAPLWSVKYGDYVKQDEFFKSNLYNNKSYGKEVLSSDAFNRVIQFGKDYFGLSKLTMPIEEFAPANKFLKLSNMFAQKSRIAKDKDSAVKLFEKARKEELKAEESIAGIRKRVLDTILI